LSLHTTESLSPETTWVLARAFLPPGLTVDLPPDPASVWTEALRLRMAPRIASRCGETWLSQELGEKLGRSFMMVSRQAAVDALKIEAQVRYLARVATSHGISFTLLKGAALHLSRSSGPGARPLVDCDILASHSDGLRLSSALRGDGWERQTIWRHDYHLPPLVRQNHLAIEIHDFIPLVCVNGRSWVCFDDLRRDGFLTAIPGLPDSASIPTRQFLAAHAIAHAIVQPPFHRDRSVATLCSDLLDIGCGGEDFGPATRALVARHVNDALLHEVLDLLRLISIGADGALRQYVRVFQEMGRSQSQFELSHTGHVVRAVHPLPGCPAPIRSRVRSLLELVFSCKPSLTRVYGKGKNESYPRLLVRRYWFLLRRNATSSSTGVSQTGHASGLNEAGPAVPSKAAQGEGLTSAASSSETERDSRNAGPGADPSGGD
jgi:hypothetical protein